MLTIDRCVNAELLEVAFERVQKDLDSAQPGDCSLGQIRNFSRSSRFQRWALDCAADLLMVRKFPDIAQSVLGLLTAGILVGMEVQRSAAEVGALENLYTEDPSAGAGQGQMRREFRSSAVRHELGGLGSGLRK